MRHVLEVNPIPSPYQPVRVCAGTESQPEVMVKRNIPTPTRIYYVNRQRTGGSVRVDCVVKTEPNF
jgi:hypothetical protein